MQLSRRHNLGYRYQFAVTQLTDLKVGDLGLGSHVRVVAGEARHAEAAPVDRPVARGPLGADRRRDRRVVGSVVWVVEEGRRVALEVLLRDHAVHGRPVESVGPDLHDVARVDHKRAGDRRHVMPLAVVLHLQRLHGTLREYCNRARVRVWRDAPVRLGLGADWVVVEAQVARVPVELAVKVVGRHAEALRHGAREHLRDPLRRAKVLAACGLEEGDAKSRVGPLVEPVKSLAVEQPVLRAQVEALLPVALVLGQLVVVPSL
mmetsp:Transcript_15498/g.39363  ORF Transcript_15498/g.39363 Transcript_15498/m.39363 type:complete len:262 (-) Transcript_15498:50-835(-)